MAKPEYIWAIGDIHGYSSSLAAVLKHINEFNTKRIIYLGDYIDRGPDPKETIDLILEQKTESTLLMGNHELMLLNILAEGGKNDNTNIMWHENGN